MKNYLPIRKVAIGLTGAGLVWASQRLGMSLGSQSANEAATALVGFAFAYAAHDPQVVKLVREAEAEVVKVEELASGDVKPLPAPDAPAAPPA